MKKFLIVAAIAIFTLVSCSEDDAAPISENPQPEALLLKKEIVTYSPNYSFTMLFNYNENNELERVDYPIDGGYINYTYSNGLIIESNDYSGTDVLQFKETFEYNNDGKLSIYRFFHYGVNDDAVNKITYTYNADGTITMMRFGGDAVSQTDLEVTQVYTLNGGNITQIATTPVNGVTETSTSTYDTKNSPYKDIPGYAVVLLAHSTKTNINNRLTLNSDTYSASSFYEYNNEGYPISMENTSTSGQDYSVQYFYQ